MKTINELAEVAEAMVMNPKQFQHVVVSLDLSCMDQSVLEYLDFWADQFPIRQISAVHVVPGFNFLRAIPDPDLMGLGGMIDLTDQLLGSLKKTCFDYFENEGNAQMNFHILEGNPLEVILRIAEESESELLILGKKPFNEGQGILAKNLIRKAAANTLVVPEQAKESIKRILVPIDFSDSSGKAFQEAIEMAQSLSERPVIDLLYIFDSPDLSVYKVQIPREAYHGMLTTYVQEAMDNFLENHRGTWKGKVNTRMLEKERPGIAPYIYQEALENGNDLIIIGAKGHSTVERLFLGSVTEKLLHINDSIPVLVIK
ncbi:MAG: universal stress protein [Bacteroidota bacterium]